MFYWASGVSVHLSSISFFLDVDFFVAEPHGWARNICNLRIKDRETNSTWLFCMADAVGTSEAPTNSVLPHTNIVTGTYHLATIPAPFLQPTSEKLGTQNVWCDFFSERLYHHATLSEIEHREISPTQQSQGREWSKCEVFAEILTHLKLKLKKHRTYHHHTRHMLQSFDVLVCEVHVCGCVHGTRVGAVLC